MVDALVKATHGERSDFVLPANRGDEIGKLGEVLSAFHENLEQVRRTADELDRSENHLRAVVDHTLDGLITIDATGTIKSFNPACERIFDYSAEEVIGRNVKMLMPEPYQAEHDGYLSRYLESGEPHIIGTSGREVSAPQGWIDIAYRAFGQHLHPGRRHLLFGHHSRHHQAQRSRAGTYRLHPGA